MVCPQFLHNQCEYSQAIVQELSSDLSEGEHTQSAPELGPGRGRSHHYVMTATELKWKQKATAVQPLEGWTNF